MIRDFPKCWSIPSKQQQPKEQSNYQQMQRFQMKLLHKLNIGDLNVCQTQTALTQRNKNKQDIYTYIVYKGVDNCCWLVCSLINLFSVSFNNVLRINVSRCTETWDHPVWTRWTSVLMFSVQFDIAVLTAAPLSLCHPSSPAPWLWDSSVLIFNYCQMDGNSGEEEEKRAEARPCG